MTGWLVHAVVLLTLCLFCKGEPCDTDLPVSGFRRYSSPGYFSSAGYDTHLVCHIHVWAENAGATLRLEMTSMDIEPKDHYGNCQDKVVVYDGTTTYDSHLMTFCGRQLLEVKSTGRDALLVFTTDGYRKGKYRGFKMSAFSVNDPSDYGSDSIPAWHIVLYCLPVLVVYVLFGFLIYRRCKLAQQVRRNLAVTGHTAADLRMAMLMMMEQASRGPLVTPNSQGGATTNHREEQRHSRRDVRIAMNTMMAQASQGPITNPQDPLQAMLMQHMDQNAAKRGRGPRQQPVEPPAAGRMRHPAGDYLGQDAYTMDGSHPSPTPPNVNNNVTANNNTAANLNYPPGQHHYQPQQQHPTGVYYAGDVDSRGVLHVPRDYYREDNDASRQDELLLDGAGSSSHRSARSGRRSPREPLSDQWPSRSGSPHDNHPSAPSAHPPNDTLTYYGVIDDLQANPPSDARSVGHMPPPSYDEVTGGGRWSPYHD